MKALRKENEELKADLARAKEDHQYDNLVHEKEIQKLLEKNFNGRTISLTIAEVAYIAGLFDGEGRCSNV